MMDYFRRPALVGRNVQRTTVATVRGAIRRHDADGVFPAPYFEGVSAGDTLDIEHQGGPVTVVLTGEGINTVLDDINAALGANGVAVDADGCIELRSTALGANGVIGVTGGTAAELLGFQTFSGTRAIYAFGGQIPSSPEGRLGNAFDVAFPGRGENFTTESMQRGLARIASNADILWTEATKERIRSKAVSFVVGTDGLFITPTSSQRLFVGNPTLGALTAASTKKDLIPYFQLIDTATGLPAQSQVVAVVRGTPVGDPPYVDSPGWTDTTGKNVLGLEQNKVTTVAIDDVTEGRFIECSGATFVTSGVLAGDFVTIAGATNLSRWSNNGKRWIVERVLSETVISLRPMTKTELDIAGASVNEVQPVIELNDQKTGIETFGTITISTGPFAHNVNLVVRPPIPTGASYELRASVPLSDRDSLGLEEQRAQGPALLEYASSVPPTHNGTLSGAVASMSAGNIDITAGIIRWNGHVHSIPATTILNASLTDGINYIYWDEETVTYKATTSPANLTSVLNPSVSTNKGHLIALAVRFAGVTTAVSSANRLIADAARTVTVGLGGQFANLDQAMNYISAFFLANGESSTSDGTYPHFEIVIVGDTTFVGPALSVSVQAPGLIIRGISKNITLTVSGAFVLDQCQSFELRDLTIVPSGTPGALVDNRSTSANSHVRILNVQQSTGEFERVVIGGSFVDRVLIEDCAFRVTSGIVLGTPSGIDAGIIELLKSNFTFASGVAAPQMIVDEIGTTWAGGRITVDQCYFLGEWLTNSTNPLFVETSDAGSQVLVQDSLFVLGAHPSASNATLFALAGRGHFERVRMESGGLGTIPTFVNGASAIVSFCELQCNPEGTQAAVNASSAFNTTITHPDTDSNVVGGIGLQISNRAYGNLLIGPFSYGIKTTNDNTSVVSNRLFLSNGANALPLIGIQAASETHVLIDENFVSMPERPAAVPIDPPAGIAVTSSPFASITIRNNRVSMAENGNAIQVGTLLVPVVGDNLIISGNNIYAQCTFAGVAMGISLNGDATSALVHGNQIYVIGDGSASGIYQDIGNYTRFVVSENRVYIEATNGGGGVYYCALPNSSQEISGNIFEAGAFSQKVSGFRGITNGNQFLGASTFLISDCQGVFCNNYVSVASGGATLGSGRYDNNTFGISNVNGSVTVVDMQFTNNSLTGNFNSGSSSTDHMTFSGNKVAGNTTIGNSVATKLVMVGNELLGSLTVSNGSSTTDVILDSTYVEGAASISANSSLVISNCVFKHTGTQTIAGNTYCMVTGCQFFGSINMDGFAKPQILTGCQITGNVAFTQDVSDPRWEVSNCLITPSSTTIDALKFPAFSFPSTTEITVHGNTILLDSGGGVGPVLQCSAIRLQGGGSRLNVTGNRVMMRGGTDPGGVGSFTFACLKIEGAAAHDGIVFSSNLMEKDNDVNFRTGALIISYKFISAANASLLGGAANILITGGTTAAGAGRGDPFYHGGVGAFAL